MRILTALYILIGLFTFNILHAVPTPWLNAEKHGSRAYFLHAAAPRIEIYDLENEVWLSALELTKTPNLFHIDDAFLYISYGKSVYRYSHAGENETLIATFPTNILSIHTDGDILFTVTTGDKITFDSFNRNTGATIDNYVKTDYSYWPNNKPATIIHSSRKLASISGNDLYSISYDVAGNFSAQTRTYINSLSQNMGADFFVFDGSSRLIGKSGKAFEDFDVEPFEDLGTSISDIAFIENALPVVLSDKKLTAYSLAFQETGSTTLQTEALSIFLSATKVFAFSVKSDSPNGMGAEIVSFETLGTDDPNKMINPENLGFTPKHILFDKHDVVYLTHPFIPIMFRWDTNTRSWLDSIPLLGTPSVADYSKNSDGVYLGYETGEITKIDTSLSSPNESTWVTTTDKIELLIASGDFLFVDRISESDKEYYIYNSAGTVVDVTDHSYTNHSGVWNAAASSVLYTVDGPNVRTIHIGAIDNTGNLAEAAIDQNVDTYTQLAPLYSHPSESKVLTTFGFLIDPTARTTLTTIPEVSKGATWIGSKLYTAQEHAVNSWNESTYAKESTLEIAHTNLALFTDSTNQLVLVSSNANSKISFTNLTPSLTIETPTDLSAPLLNFDKNTANAARVSWSNIAGATSYLLERSSIDDPKWSQISELGFDSSRYSDVNLTPGKEYYYRIKSKNGSVVSSYSNTVEANLAVTPNDLPIPLISAINNTPRTTFVDNSDILYLVFDQIEAIFRYDTSEQKWLDAIPLKSSPIAAYYSNDRNSILIAYHGGQVNEVALNAEILSEQTFAKAQHSVYSIVSHNSRVITIDDNGNHTLFDQVGDELSRSSFGSTSQNQKIFWTGNSYYWGRYNRIYESNIVDDTLTSQTSVYTSYGSLIGINAEKSLILFSDGALYPTTLTGKINDLESNVSSSTWVDGNLITAYDKKITSWALPTYSANRTAVSQLNIYGIHATTTGKIIVVSAPYNKPPSVEILDLEFNTVPPAKLAETKLRTNNLQSTGVNLEWEDIGGELSYEIERQEVGGEWIKLNALQKNTTSYIDSTLQTGVNYNYRVRGINGEIETRYSATLLVDTTPPEATANLTAEIIDGSNAKLQWTAASNALQYKVLRTTSNYFSTLTTLPSDTLEFVDSNIDNGIEYTYKIESLGSIGQLAESKPVSIAIYETIPIAPNKPSIISLGYYDTYISWNNAYNTTAYRLERSIDSATLDWVTAFETTSAQVTTYLDEGLEANTSYHYRLIAINPTGESTPSATLKASTKELVTPYSPQIFAGQIDDSNVQLFWNLVPTATSYKLYKREFNTDDWIQLGTEFGSKSNSYLDPEVSQNSSYTYSVIATNAKGESQRSNEIALLIKPLVTTFSDDFESGYNKNKYVSTQNNIVGTTNKSLGFTSGRRSLDTIPIDLKNGGTLSFDLKFVGENGTNPTNDIYLYVNTDTSSSYLARLGLQDIGDLSDWRKFSFNLPENVQSDAVTVRWIVSINSYNEDYLAIDNIKISRYKPIAPMAPLTVVAKTANDGGTSIFWTPVAGVDHYLLEVSTDSGATWLERKSLSPEKFYFHDTNTYTTGTTYRVTSINVGGKSAPILSNAIASNVALVTATQLGIDKVLSSPEDYKLYSAIIVDQARIDGRSDVKSHPELYGLSLPNVVSHYYYHLEMEPITIDGDLLSLPWTIYQSSDLDTWTPYTTTINYELGTNQRSSYYKITPQLESQDPENNSTSEGN